MFATSLGGTRYVHPVQPVNFGGVQRANTGDTCLGGVVRSPSEAAGHIKAPSSKQHGIVSSKQLRQVSSLIMLHATIEA